MPTDAFFPYPWFLSLSSIHIPFYILRIESLFRFFPFKGYRSSLSDRVHSENARPRVNGRSRACALVSYPILQLCVSILMRWPSFSELAAGFDLAPFQKSVDHSSPRPRCLGCWTKVSFCGNLFPTKGTSQRDYKPVPLINYRDHCDPGLFTC